MDEILEYLKALDRKLDLLLGERNLSEVLEKSHYSCEEVAELTQRHGTKKPSRLPFV